jgi:hypothetical protein
MKLEELITIAQLTDFLSGTQAVAFSVFGSKDECYRFLQTELARWGYLTLPRWDKGIVTRYLMKVSGYSRQHVCANLKLTSLRPCGSFCGAGRGNSNVAQPRAPRANPADAGTSPAAPCVDGVSHHVG